jgi:putative Holliday junction resolvase
MITKRAIAFDIGNKRIGVAISDPFNEYAMPCETYNRVGNFWTDVTAIAKIAEERGVGVIVCGIPYNFDGSESIQTVKTMEFIEALKTKTSLPIELEDERFTTMQARETQIMGGVKRGDRKKTIDSIAASYILESYLEREKNKNKRTEESVMNKKIEESRISGQEVRSPDKDMLSRKLENEINALYDRLAQALKAENERLRLENMHLREENEHLKRR